MEDDAIVLDSLDHNESDLIITFFCRNTGKLSAMAKGAKKSKIRFVNKLEIFSFLHISYSLKEGRDLGFLSEAELHTIFPNLRGLYTQYVVASVIREFLLLSVREGEADPSLFRLSLWSLHNLDKKQPAKAVLVLFLIQFFEHIGYRPDFQRCGSCGSPLSGKVPHSRFDCSSGQLVCEGCSQQISHGQKISQGTLKMLSSAQSLPPERLHIIKPSGSMLHEALTLLHSYGREIFQREIISWKLFDSLNT